jgi:hypothetical protein
MKGFWFAIICIGIFAFVGCPGDESQLGTTWPGQTVNGVGGFDRDDHQPTELVGGAGQGAQGGLGGTGAQGGGDTCPDGRHQCNLDCWDRLYLCKNECEQNCECQ